ncbi:MAG: NAD(P)/FAD-dependent oxidoreductase [Elusimicrobia bacterium]|nr:NAD(P)/FAD-dependent oxidoreductase [Elusimicrobiota bacterium]
MASERDRELGMDRPITRRDFLGGMALAAGAALSAPGWARALKAAAKPAKTEGGFDPPALGGIRGDNSGSFEVAHALRDGGTFDGAQDIGERYDLIVVGGGMSGLAAAYFFRKRAGPKATVLILDCHDDFGGHCKRNEFKLGERTLIAHGGNESIDAPASFSPEGKALFADIGVDMRRFYTAFDQELYRRRGLNRGLFFARETFGEDRLVVGEPPGYEGKGPYDWDAFLAKTPLPEAARRDIKRIYEGDADPLAGLPSAEKAERLFKMSYRDYLTGVLKVGTLAAEYMQARTHDSGALGADGLNAWWCYNRGYAGFDGLRLDPPAGVRSEDEPYIFHFPDGNAGVARLLVRWLIPAALPGRTMDDSVTNRLEYARLDEAGAPVRLRLNATAVRASQLGGKEVEVTYVNGPLAGEGQGKAFRVRAPRCVLACENLVVPYLCPELPEEQKAALRTAVRAPMVYTKVLVRDTRAFQKLGLAEAHCPGCYYADIHLEFPVSMGRYRFPAGPEEPAVVHCLRAPLKPGLPPREQFRAGRAELLATPFETFERETRSQLARMLAGGGFDPARDIEAITVNRFPHGYPPWKGALVDPDGIEKTRPWLAGRRLFGRIAIANADCAAYPFMQASFDEAHRAVGELV